LRDLLKALVVAFVVPYGMFSTLLPLGVWFAQKSLLIAIVCLLAGVITIVLFLIVMLITIIGSERLPRVISSKDWLLVHVVFTASERIGLPLVFTVVFFLSVYSMSQPRMFDAALLAFWFEVVWLGFIYLGRDFRNYLGMDYRGFEFASISGAISLASLSDTCFGVKKYAQGIFYLLKSLQITRGYLQSISLQCEELERSIIYLRLFREIVLKQDSVPHTDRIEHLAATLSKKDLQGFLSYLPALKVHFATIGVSWVKSFKTVERRISLSATVSIVTALLIALASLLSEQVKNQFSNWLAAAGSPEFILSCFDIVFALLGYPFIDSYLNRIPVHYSDLKLMS